MNVLFRNDRDAPTGFDNIAITKLRKLNFNSGVKERVSEIVDAADVLITPPSAPRLSWIAETCHGAPMHPTTKLMKLNFNSGVKERVSEIVDAADVLITPPSSPRLSWIAERCPGAPMHPARNMNTRLCRMLVLHQI
ncbi:cyclin-dependent protein kinase inhibitor SMR11-like protein [Tanacetum coccineum]